MEEKSNDSGSTSFNTENKIRFVQSKIQAQLENFEKAPDTMFAKTSYVCDDVMDHILNYQDEPYLSKTQNTYRRIFIASELFVSFCPIYAQFVGHEYTKIIRDMVQWEKYKKLSKKITYKMQIELRREKYFNGEARRKLFKTLEDKRINEVVSSDTAERNSELELLQRQEKESLPAGLGPVEEVTQPSLPFLPGKDINVTLHDSPLLEGSFTSELPSNFIANLTEIRGEAMTEATQLDLPTLDIRRGDLSLTNMDAEISISAPTMQQKYEDIEKILQILEEETFPEEAAEIQQPENLIGLAEKLPEPVLEETMIQNPPTSDVMSAEVLEDSEKWSLPSLEGVEEIKRKRHYLIIDKSIVIQDYAAKALHLNRNISVERIQVFKGPPTVLHAISANYLMTTPSHRSSLSRDIRSSRLTTLYNRHLEVQKKPVEEVFQRKRTVEELREIDISKVRAHTEIVQDVLRAGMHSRPDRSDVLVESAEKHPQCDLDITSTGIPPKESLVGVPLNRIVNSTIPPPEDYVMDRINSAPVVPTPSVQQLQGKSLDIRASPPWFISTKENPPNSKYREFNYVYNQLNKYWSISESQGLEKSITMREFFSFETNVSFADYLTVLRIVDKMSIQRKLLLEHKSGDVVIRPFDVPFLSEAQLLLKEKESIF